MDPRFDTRQLQIQPVVVTPQPSQGTLFALSMLPRQPRSYKALEEEFLPPRDQRLVRPH